MPLSLLRDLFINELKNNGVRNTEYRSEKLKHCIENEFGELIGFYNPPDRTGYLLYKADKSQLVDMLDKIHNVVPEESTETEGDSSTECNKNSSPQEVSYLDVLHCALFFRKLVRSVANRISWPPQMCNLVPDRSEEIMPDGLYNLLLWMIEGYDSNNEDPVPLDVKHKAQSPNIHRKVVSIAQDIIYCTSKGRIRTPKHILLPMTIHNMTGSKSVVTLINRFGHGISYTELEELQTAMAASRLSQNNADDVYLPSNINPAQRVNLCFDNNDINEETLNGSGTTHCTNGIAIQRQLDFNFSTSVAVISCQKHRSKARTIATPPSSLAEYCQKERCGPGKMYLNLSEFTCKHMLTAEKLDFVWFLT